MYHVTLTMVKRAFKGGKIPYWKLSYTTKVFPHLELAQRYYTQKEMRELCIKLKTELPELNILIYDENTYCCELNGAWNVCFAVGDPDKGLAYTYIIRSCNDFNKTYGCPFINYEYIQDLKITALHKSTNSKMFNIVESKLMEIMPNAKKVNYFDT